MKKSELPNCPQWLLDADTKNEDVRYDALGRVEWLSGTFLGGTFRGGSFLGGRFLGGDFWGGNFLGGTFRGGRFLGSFLGGRFLGGDFRGGSFLGGTFRGGKVQGGNFQGGNFLGGTFLDASISRRPITIYGLTWPVYITQAGAKIGCQAHSVAAWNTFLDSEINAMAPGALTFWRQNKGLILSVLNHEASFPVAKVIK